MDLEGEAELAAEARHGVERVSAGAGKSSAGPGTEANDGRGFLFDHRKIFSFGDVGPRLEAHVQILAVGKKERGVLELAGEIEGDGGVTAGIEDSSAGDSEHAVAHVD